MYFVCNGKDFVVVKMDIEGAEYTILPHLLKTSAWLNIDYLLVEWHEHLTPKENQIAAKEAVESMKTLGVKMPIYDSYA